MNFNFRDHIASAGVLSIDHHNPVGFEVAGESYQATSEEAEACEGKHRYPRALGFERRLQDSKGFDTITGSLTITPAKLIAPKALYVGEMSGHGVKNPEMDEKHKLH